MSSTRTRRSTAVLTAACLLLAGAAVATAAPATAAPGFTLERLQGADRYATAAAIARDGFVEADVALLANGQNDDPRTSRNESHFPDALAASYLSGLRTAPTLLTTETSLPRATADALAELGVTTVVIVGGPAAVSLAQEQQLRDDGYAVQRVAGTNRYATAAAVARAAGSTGVGTVGGLRTAIVASGVNFPDALVMGPLAYAGKLPLTITDPVRLSAETRGVLTELGIQQVLVAGGASAVGAGVESEMERLGMTVRRFGGSGRTETARLVAEYAATELGFSDRHVHLALGLRFPDALAGGPHAGALRSPILLTAGVDTLGSSARSYLEDHSGALRNGHVLGGTSAVSSGVQAEAEQAGHGDGTSSPSPAPSTSPPTSPSPSPSPSSTTPPPATEPTSEPSPSAPAPSGLQCSTEGADLGTAIDLPTATSGPELKRVEYKGAPTANTAGTATTADDFCQVDVQFTFDEPAVGPAPKSDRFLLVGFDPAVRHVGRGAIRNAEGTVVTVTFGRPDDPATPVDERESLPQQALSAVSLAAVEQDTVIDADGAKNPIGDSPIGPSRSVSDIVGGVTQGPDLLTVSPLTPTSFAFDFDQPVAVVKSTGFHVVSASRTDVVCSGPVASGSRVTASCALPLTESPARGFVDSRTVTDMAPSDLPMANVLQAAAVLDSGGLTDGPDLVQVAKVKDKPKQLMYVFDEDVFVHDEKKFVAYEHDTVELQSDSALGQSSDPRAVVATFLVAPGADLAGGAVLKGAVVKRGTAILNQEDEVALPGDAVGATTGDTLAPDLTGITIGTGDTPTVTFLFDEAILPNVVLSALSLYTDGNQRLICATGAAVAGPSGITDSVECTQFRTSPDGAASTRAASGNEVRSATIGTADDGAVRDKDSKPNPEGVQLTQRPA